MLNYQCQDAALAQSVKRWASMSTVVGQRVAPRAARVGIAQAGSMVHAVLMGYLCAGHVLPGASRTGQVPIRASGVERGEAVMLLVCLVGQSTRADGMAQRQSRLRRV